ncbi:hypothetical protein EDB80DRAFT_706425 [Ilyonectria destructans]|nr:hypothetical protein EDB80DRAFT_706425 [Ilyonectria destructans]
MGRSGWSNSTSLKTIRDGIWIESYYAVVNIKICVIFFDSIAINIPNGRLLVFGSIIIKNLGLDASSQAYSPCYLASSPSLMLGSLAL